MKQRKLSRFQALDFRSVYKPSRFAPAAYVEWALLLLAGLVAFFIFMYMDYPNTIDNSVLLVKAVCSGHFFDFYEYTIENAATNYAANYEILAYVPFAVWNLPLAVLNMTTGFDYLNSVPALLWSKALLALMGVASLYFCYRILRRLSLSREFAVLGCYLIATSITAFWPLMMIAQIDIAGVLLMLIGFLLYLEDKLLPFTVLFALAVPFKSFALLLYIPLILLREKRIVYLFFSGALLLGPLAICKLLFSGSVMYNTALKTQSREGMDQLFNFSDLLGNNKLSLFVLAFAVLCVLCYIYKPKTPQSLQNAAVYTSLIIWAALLVLTNLRSYWLIYASPFIIFAILKSGRFLKVNLLLELFGGVFYMLHHFCSNGAVAKDVNICRRLVLSGVLETTEEGSFKYETVHGMMEWMGLMQFRWVFFTLFAACMISVCVLCCPKLFRKAERDTQLERTAVMLRPLLLLALIGVYLFAMTAQTPKPVADFIDMDTAVSTDADLYTVKRVSQTVDFPEDGELHYIAFAVRNSLDNRRNFGHVDIILNDLTTGKEAARQTVGSAILEDRKITTVGFEKVFVTAGDRYELVFEGVMGLDEELTNKENTLALMRTETLEDAAHPAMIDGVAQDYNLAVRIS